MTELNPEMVVGDLAAGTYPYLCSGDSTLAHSRRVAPDRPRTTPGISFQQMVLNNDEIEVACDALWLVKLRGAWDDAQERIWLRLQPVRTGDYGGSATVELEPEEEAAIARALRCGIGRVELDEDEERLLVRLTDGYDAA